VTASLTFDGRQIPVRPGQTVAGALWQAGVRAWRTTRLAGRPRGLFCGIGACFDCLVTVDGTPNVRACLAPARSGMDVRAEAPSAPAGATRSDRALGRFEVAVVGGGPAGLAAAASAALAGCRVALVDSGQRLGGQFWRHAEGSDGRGHRDWSVFTGLRSVVAERVEHVAGAAVWFVEPGFVLHTEAGRVEAGRLVLATGAYDRALPFPGWDRPGVVTPGAAQALLKGSGVPIGERVVVAGAGPFLLPVAVGLLDAGVRVMGVYEAGDPRSYLRRPGALAAAVGKVGEAAGYAAALARRRVPYRTRRAVVAAHGDGGVSEVEIARLDGSGRREPGPVERVACDAVAVGYGFTANLELAVALGCRTVRSPDGGLAVGVAEHGRTSVPGVFAAGEVTGVGGASLAVVEGLLAGWAAAIAAGADPPPARELASLRRRQDRLRTFAEAMHAAHAPPADWPSWLTADTLVCRCEEVPYGEVARAVEWGGVDARTVKSLARPGMGWCQGRVCGYSTAELTARLCGRSVTDADLAAFASRPFAAPVLLGDLAADDADPMPVDP
jgi:NADPH-dependent 2,4-dienoyl-CoA reductase/sulfur reductase-like enzyme